MTGPNISRRAVLGGAAGLAVLGVPLIGSAQAGAQAHSRSRQDGPIIDQPPIRPRADWATKGPTGPIQPEDVRFLLVHHTLAPGNDYTEAKVPALLQGIFNFHTSNKGWPDIAYNFMVDQFGVIWEAREGSIAGPVQGDATGGNQGFSQLCCFLGDLSSMSPTDVSVASMSNLLAWLAVRYDVDPSPGKTVDFVSRGSNLFNAGAPVTVNTIAGHRDVSQTACPGDAGYEVVQNILPNMVAAQLLAATPSTTTTTEATTTTAEPTTTAQTSTTAASSTTEQTAPSTAVDEDAGDEVAVAENSGDSGGLPVGLIAAGVGTLAVGGGLFFAAKKAMEAGEESNQEEPGVSLIRSEGAFATDGPPTEPAASSGPPAPEAGFVGAAAATASVTDTPTTVAATAAAAPTAPPQRVWWATGQEASAEVRARVQRLAAQVGAFAANPAETEEEDRATWAHFEQELAEAARDHQAAVVAARPGTVYLLRNGRSTARVTAPDGHIRRDSSAEALAVGRSDVAVFEVFFGEIDRAPEIQVRSAAPKSG